MTSYEVYYIIISLLSKEFFALEIFHLKASKIAQTYYILFDFSMIFFIMLKSNIWIYDLTLDKLFEIDFEDISFS